MEKSSYSFGAPRMWCLPLIMGLIFVGFGVWCLCNPTLSMPILSYIFAGAIGAVGIFNVIYGLCNLSSYHGWGWAVGSGIVEILFSIFLFFIPTNLLTYIFVYGVGLYIIFMAIYSFFDSFNLFRGSFSWIGCFALFLLASVVFACIFILGPVGPGLVGWLSIGISFICYGIFRILFACRLRELQKNVEK